jgi:predicted nucleotidyltransferase component of viral defense system
MNPAIDAMLSKYDCSTTEAFQRALHEILQEVCLLGLWRSKFFEHAAFYGGTALRILHGIERFSEDLDFSLLKANKNFSLEPYFEGLTSELASFGFDVEIEHHQKQKQSAIESAFLKANTLTNLIVLGYRGTHHRSALLKIKLEIDRDPPPLFQTNSEVVLLPTPFSVRTYVPSDLFAGKMHALLFRKWGTRVKGRDWFDFIWFVSRGIPLNLIHLRERCRQSEGSSNFRTLPSKRLLELLQIPLMIPHE